jgi:hypothetical protein
MPENVTTNNIERQPVSVVECNCICHNRRIISETRHMEKCCEGSCPICRKWFRSGLNLHALACEESGY